jgi:uncharacterized YigZ family protein
MTIFYFHTIKDASEGIFKEKGSKFLAFAYPVVTEEEVKKHLEMLRKKYFDTRHHCYAWVLGVAKENFRANDDGEPNHSAGDPILGQIRSRDLTNVLVVVVRYFGGTKLGVSGLIQAYRTAAEDALNHAVIIRKELMQEGILSYPYESTTEIQRLIKDFELIIVEQQFGESCLLNVEIRQSVLDLFVEKVELLKSTGTLVTLALEKR